LLWWLLQRHSLFAGYGPKVGSIDVAVSVNGQAFATLATIDDFKAHDMVSVTNFTIEIKVPDTATDKAVLRVRYVSNNPLEIDPANNTAAIFYNCADIKITADEGEVSPFIDGLPPALATAATKSFQFDRRSSLDGDFTCASTPLFHAFGETISRAGKVTHEIWYDGVRQLVRWDRRGSIVNGTADAISTITNYSDVRKFGVPEFVIHPEHSKCDIYGADAFYPWTYGGSDQPFVRNVSVAGRTVHVFNNPTSGMTWQAVQVLSESGAAFCLPLSVEMALGDSATEFLAEPVNAFDAKIFTPPAYCKAPSHETVMRCSDMHRHIHH
jgi:hypothetical protein